MTAPSPIGTVKIRTRHKRGGERRAWVKVGQPNTWRLRAQVVWEEAHGPIPAGFIVHHRNRDTLNDGILNLELVSKAGHLAEHRPEFAAKAKASFVQTRRLRRWSTKSVTKRTGRPPSWTDDQLRLALEAITNGMGIVAAARNFGISRTTLHKKRART